MEIETNKFKAIFISEFEPKVPSKLLVAMLSPVFIALSPPGPHDTAILIGPKEIAEDTESALLVESAARSVVLPATNIPFNCD